MIAGLALGAWLLGAAGDPQTAAAAELAEKLSAQILQAAPQPPLALALEGGEGTAGLSTLLAAKLAQSRLAPAALRCEVDCDRQALDAGARTLVRLTLTRKAGTWSADGELHGVWRNFWAGQREVRPPRPAAALHASVALLQAAPSPGAARALAVRELGRLPEPVEAIVGADLDGDGAQELLALTDAALYAFDAQGKPLARHPLDGLPRARVSSRDPLGALAVEASPPTVLAFSQNRARGERLRWDVADRAFVAVGTLEAPRVGCDGQSLEVAFTPGENTFEPLRPHAPFPRVSRRWSALACRLGGQGASFVAVLPDGTARLKLPKGSRSLQGVGAGIGLVDLDGDGAPEVVTTSFLLAPEQDTLTVTPAEGAALTAALPGRILALAPLRRAGRAEEAVAVAQVLPDGQTQLSLVEEVVR